MRLSYQITYYGLFNNIVSISVYIYIMKNVEAQRYGLIQGSILALALQDWAEESYKIP